MAARKWTWRDMERALAEPRGRRPATNARRRDPPRKKQVVFRASSKEPNSKDKSNKDRASDLVASGSKEASGQALAPVSSAMKAVGNLLRVVLSAGLPSGLPKRVNFPTGLPRHKSPVSSLSYDSRVVNFTAASRAATSSADSGRTSRWSTGAAGATATGATATGTNCLGTKASETNTRLLSAKTHTSVAEPGDGNRSQDRALAESAVSSSSSSASSAKTDELLPSPGLPLGIRLELEQLRDQIRRCGAVPLEGSGCKLSGCKLSGCKLFGCGLPSESFTSISSLVREFLIPIEELKFEALLPGATSSTYRGSWLGKTVAIKVFTGKLIDSHAWVQYCKMLAALAHPNLIQVLGVAMKPPFLWCVVSEYLHKGSLANLFRQPQSRDMPWGPGRNNECIIFWQRDHPDRGSPRLLDREGGSGAEPGGGTAPSEGAGSSPGVVGNGVAAGSGVGSRIGTGRRRRSGYLPSLFWGPRTSATSRTVPIQNICSGASMPLTFCEADPWREDLSVLAAGGLSTANACCHRDYHLDLLIRLLLKKKTPLPPPTVPLVPSVKPSMGFCVSPVPILTKPFLGPRQTAPGHGQAAPPGPSGPPRQAAPLGQAPGRLNTGSQQVLNEHRRIKSLPPAAQAPAKTSVASLNLDTCDIMLILKYTLQGLIYLQRTAGRDDPQAGVSCHGNIKPSNILLTDQHEAKLGDYCEYMIERAFQPVVLDLDESVPCPKCALQTRTLQLVPTVQKRESIHFLAPEFLRKPIICKSNTVEADIYSFGLTTAAVLLKKIPYPQLSPTQIRVVRGFSDVAPEIIQDLDNGWEPIKSTIIQCIQQDPSRRCSWKVICNLLLHYKHTASAIAENALISFLTGNE